MDAELARAAESALKDCSRFLFFLKDQTVLAANFDVNIDELPGLLSAYSSREEAIKHGLTLAGARYEVHRYHTPLIYGRTHSSDPEGSEGIAMCLIDNSTSGEPCIAVITYRFPIISAKIIPVLQKFCYDFVQPSHNVAG